MYIEKVPNRNSRPTILLREGKRVGKKVVKRTIANLTNWPEPVVEALRASLKGNRLTKVEDVFQIERSLPHGHVEAVLDMMRRLKLDRLISAKPCKQRDLVMAMVAERLIHPCSKLATTRLWHTTSLAGELKVEDAEVDELYEAMDWLMSRQGRIEKKLAKRHLKEGGPVLYDVTSSYYEGHSCVLMMFGHSRDQRSDRPQIVYGAMTDARGCPVSVQVYRGNVGDPSTVADQVEKLRERFGLTRAVLVGDRGMLTETQIRMLKRYPGLGWIYCLRSSGIRKLADDGCIERSLFDECNLAEITSPEFPGERLVVCFNPLLADERKRKRDELLEATEKALMKLAVQIERRTKKPFRKEEIAFKVGKVINRWKMEKHFTLSIEEGSLTWSLDETSIEREEALDGLYVVRTSEAEEWVSAEDAVRTYKSLSQVERAFRTLKGVDLKVRPIHHRLEGRVRAHVFLCMLAYYVEWHMRQALKPLLFDDEELALGRHRRDPVAKSEPSMSAKKKKHTKQIPEGFAVHSFETLLREMSTRCKNWCRSSGSPVQILTEASPFQKHVFQLIRMFPVTGI